MLASLLNREDAPPAPLDLETTRPFATESYYNPNERPPLVSPSITSSEFSLPRDASEAFTPPTSLGDSASISSTSLKQEAGASTPTVDSSRRSIRTRDSIATYNVKILAGTAIHAPKRYQRKSAGEDETRRRTISGDTLIDDLESANASTTTVDKDAQKLVSAGIDALDLGWSVRELPKSKSQIDLGSTRSPKKSAKQADLERRKSTRSSASNKVENITNKLVLGKNLGKRKFDDGLSRAKRELLRLADTPEFAKIETKPVLLEVWSNGKLVVNEPPSKKRKAEEAAKAKEKEKAKEVLKESKIESPKWTGVNGKRRKIWLSKGLYAGQDSPSLDWFSGLKGKDRQELDSIAPYKPDGRLPLPMWHGQRLLHVGRNFKLPFDVCSPLPPGQPKPDEWKKTSTNRFVGEAGALWKKTKLFDSFFSKCVCTPQGGCDVDCQNRIMLYECDDTNCGAGRGHCTNRAFADLQERRKGGGKYRIGVEVIKTADRGYGVRSNRCFDPHQIIVEYTGEIITEDECDRRMNEDYKDNECYYLMSFDQNMIIDATKGSIARFVNHSCKPNSRMVKWIVGGKPRMALFAGDHPIMSGDELTYDYNFDPFSAKNVQECRCGSENCRGVLGPKPKDPKPIKETIKDALKGAVRAGKAVKRKAKELLAGDDDSDAPTPKKRKIKGAKGAIKSVRTGKGVKRKAKDIFDPESDSDAPATPKKRKIKEAKGVKRSASSAASMSIFKGAKAVKRTVLNARNAIKPKSNVSTPRKAIKPNMLKKYGKSQTKLSSRNSSLTIVAQESPKSVKRRASAGKSGASKNVIRESKEGKAGSTLQSASETTIRVVSTPGE